MLVPVGRNRAVQGDFMPSRPGAIALYTGRTILAADPDGNRVELWDPPKAKRQ
jgi:hypothetical protein